MSSNPRINLSEFNTDNPRALVGKENGFNTRHASKIDELAKNHEQIDIFIPNNVWAVNPSFLEELFRNAINTYGEEGFKDKFNFISHIDISADIEEAIDRVVCEASYTL